LPNCAAVIADTRSEAAGAKLVVGAAAAELRATIESPIPDRLLAAPDNTSGFVVTKDTF
jgi:hypothetical protein